MDSYKDVEYKQLERPLEKPETRRSRPAVIVLSVLCFVLLCCAIYSLGYLEWNGPKSHDIGHDGNGDTNTFGPPTNMPGPSTGGVDTDVVSKMTGGRMPSLGSEVTTRLSGNRRKSKKKTNSKSQETSTTTSGNVEAASHTLNRAVLMNRLREVIGNLRDGKEDRLSMQVSMLFLQQALRRLSRSGARQNGGRVPTRAKQTLDNPRVRSLMEALALSPHDLDIFYFTKHPQHDFRCVLLKLDLIPDPLICVNDPTKDTSVSKSLVESGMWEGDMVKYFMDLLKSDEHLQAVDLGSNLGVYSLAAASLNRPVLAVEANIRNILPFYKSVKIDSFEKLITLVTNSLSDHFKLVQLIYDENNLSHTDVVEITDFMLRSDVIHAEDVSRTVTLNDLIPAMTSNIAVLKVDLQGEEAAVFRSASTFFATIDVRYVIMHWRHSRDPGGYDNIVSFFMDRRYTPHSPVTAKLVNNRELKMDHPVIIWIKDTIFPEKNNI